MGDPAGIGPEICLRALHESSILKRCHLVLFGDAGVIRRVLSSSPSLRLNRKHPAGRRSSGNSFPCRIISRAEWEQLDSVTEPLLVDCAAVEAARVIPGRISPACGRAGYVYIELAIRAAVAGKIDGVVTAPIHKEALRLCGIAYPGHTEIFTALTKTRRSCMMLHSEALTVSMVTTHIGYREVPARLSVTRVRDVIELTAEALRRLHKRSPHIGVCGLNPHAGEHGLFGRNEEEQFVQPAVTQARELGIDVEGPLVPDAAFTTGQRRRFDAIVTLYHDQGHIPFKMLAFDTGVNITLGLPIIRTSVDHGTAFDIAWKAKADPRSLFAAINIAAQMAGGPMRS